MGSARRRWSRTGAVRPLLGLLALSLACAPAPEGEPRRPRPHRRPEATEPEPDPLASSDLPAPLDQPLPEDPMRVTIHRLPNGLTVYLAPDPRRPRITAQLAVRAGAVLESEDSTGLAHYLEHMMFKGTDELGTVDYEAERRHLDRIEVLYAELRQTDDPTRQREIMGDIDAETQASAAHAVPGELDRLYAGLGFVGVNAYTSLESTVYVADLPASRLREWAALEQERMSDPVFRLFLPELEAVYEEKNTDLDSPEERLDRAMLRALFPGSPYGERDIVGRVSHLKVPALQDMITFRRRWYVPNNMAVVLVGDFERAEALALLESTLGELPVRRLPPRELPEPEPLEGRVQREVLADAPEAVQIAWRTVPFDHPDTPALTVLEAMLADPTAGLLELELDLDDEVADSYAWSSEWQQAGYLGVGAIAHSGQDLDEVESRLLEVVGRLRNGDFEPELVQAVVLNYLIDRVQALESPEARADLIAASYTLHLPWQAQVQRESALLGVTREDVMRVATSYLGEDRVVARRRRGTPELPYVEAPEITPIPLSPDRESERARSIREEAAEPTAPRWLVEGEDYQRGQLPAGPFLTTANRDNDLFWVGYRFERGFRRAPRLCLALELLERSGLSDLDAAAFQKRLHALGGEVAVYCNAEETWLEIAGPHDNLEIILRLVKRWLAQPSPEPGALDGLREALLSSRHEQLERADWLIEALDDYARFGRRSAWLAQPSTRKLLRVDEAQLIRELERVTSYEHTTLYFGPGAPESVADVLSLGERHQRVKPRPPRRFRRTATTRIFFVDADVAQSEIRVSIPLPRQRHARRGDAALAGVVLGSDPTSRLYQEVRESRGMAYSVWGDVSTGSRPSDEWAFLGGLATQTDKSVEALEVYLDVLGRPTESTELATARSTLEGWMSGDWVMPRAVPLWIDRWALMGEDRDPRPVDLERIRSVDAETIQGLLALVGERPALIAIVGDRDRVELEALARIGKVTELDPEDLYGFGPFPPEPEPEPVPEPGPASSL